MNETEKAIGRYVCGLAIEDEKISWPHWKLFFWALLHPVKFSAAHARLKALHDVANAIERGEHRKQEKAGESRRKQDEQPYSRCNRRS